MNSWINHLQPLIDEYKDGTEEPLDGDEVDRLCEIIKAKINLNEGNITTEEPNMTKNKKKYDSHTHRETREKRILMNSIETEILDVASLYNECTKSDLQGVAMAKANTILNLVKEFLESEG